MFVKMRGKQEHYTLTYDQDRLTFILCNDAAAGSAAIAMTCMDNTLESIVLPEFALLTCMQQMISRYGNIQASNIFNHCMVSIETCCVEDNHH